MAERLFEDPKAEPARPRATQVVGIAVNANVWGSFDYLWPEGLGSPQRGQRVRVPFGRGRSATSLGFVVDLQPPPTQHALKIVSEAVDEQSPFDEVLWDLARWISEYYLTPLGMVLAAMVPSAVGRHPPRTELVARLTSERSDWTKRLGLRQRQVLDELFRARQQGIEPVTVEALRANSGASTTTIQSLRQKGLIATESRPVRLDQLVDAVEADPFSLNAAQQRVLDELQGPLAGGFSVTLLHGVTGSGKTEVYVRAIRQVLQAGRQAILLVPEIALATQTLQRLLSRLPRVAILHSQLTDAQRAFYWQQIRDGHAGVVVGPRSAVFAPARDVGLIIVDEEHEGSYKQDTAPRYHGRDVAVMRGSLCGCPVLLGSATPSMESWYNVERGRYRLSRLSERVRDLPLPQLELVPLRQEVRSGRVELIGQTMTRHIAATLDRGEQVILLMNRRGYASFVFCPSCQWTLSCDDCTRTMVFHQAIQLAMCHYCDRTATLPEACPACGGKILLFGMGIQRVEDELARKFPLARTARMDSDTMTSPAQFQRVFDDFAGGQTDILLGTQMVAKGLDFPKVTLVGVLSADTSLAIPDFRASERTFQLIVQVAGRAGRGQAGGRVVVQSVHPEEPAIQYALRHDFDGFASWELPARLETNLPPVTRMVRFIVRHTDPQKAMEAAEDLARRLRPHLAGLDADVTGPQPAGIVKIRNFFRHHLLISTPRPGVLQKRLWPRMGDFLAGLSAEVAVDADPTTLI